MLFDNFFEGIKQEPGYRSFFISDHNLVSGLRKKRKVFDPNGSMRSIHQRFLEYLRPLETRVNQTNRFCCFNSTNFNAGVHATFGFFFYQIDLKNAYQSVNGQKLAQVLCSLDGKLRGQEEEVYEFLKKTCLLKMGIGLITGAVASPILFDIYVGVLLDPGLVQLSDELNLSYSRYRDDLTFSNKRWPGRRPIGRLKRKRIRQIILNAGFQINHRKSAVLRISKGSVLITGINLVRERKKDSVGECRTQLPRRYLRKIRGLMHLVMTGKSDVNPARIHGMMGVFWNSVSELGCRPHISELNRTEQKLIRQYEEFAKRFSNFKPSHSQKKEW